MRLRRDSFFVVASFSESIAGMSRSGELSAMRDEGM
jgi:hypothetical protein